MHKTVTLRLKDDVYKIFSEIAKAENRSLSNLIGSWRFFYEIGDHENIVFMIAAHHRSQAYQ